jgi:hypothetical protein
MGKLEFGHISLHAVRRLAPQAWYTYYQGQVIEHGLMVERAGGGMLDNLAESNYLLIDYRP